MEKLGINKLKIAVLTAIEIGEKLEKALEDNKITIWEGVGLVPKLKDITFIVQNRSNIVDEFKDLSKEEKQELSQFIVSELDLKNDKIEELIEKAVIFAASVADIITSFSIFVKSDVSLDESVGGGGANDDPTDPPKEGGNG